MNLRAILLACCAVAACGADALAQDISQQPTYGEVELSSGFSPDPHVVDIVAGGETSAADTDSSCTGYVANAPDFSLRYTEDQYALSIFAVSSVDTTIMINDPGGTWHCNDDSSNLDGNNPGVYFSSPSSGRYDIWVGVYSSDQNYVSTKLVITEQGEGNWRSIAADLNGTAQDLSVVPQPEPEPPEPEPPAVGVIQYGRKL
jgi:hypothetical protein